jgi:hypothetical protein
MEQVFNRVGDGEEVNKKFDDLLKLNGYLIETLKQVQSLTSALNPSKFVDGGIIVFREELEQVDILRKELVMSQSPDSEKVIVSWRTKP